MPMISAAQPRHAGHRAHEVEREQDDSDNAADGAVGAAHVVLEHFAVLSLVFR
jgi:hypothetical protein